MIWRIPKLIVRHIIGNRKYVFRSNLRISTEPQLHIFRTTERTKTVHVPKPPGRHHEFLVQNASSAVFNLSKSSTYDLINRLHRSIFLSFPFLLMHSVKYIAADNNICFVSPFLSKDVKAKSQKQTAYISDVGYIAKPLENIIQIRNLQLHPKHQ